MKVNVKKYSNILVLVSSILFLILGAVMYTHPEAIVIITSYIFGGILVAIGLFKCIKNYMDVKKDNLASSNEMIMGITLLLFGIICIFLAGVIEALVRLIIGGWILFTGINRLINCFNYNKRTSQFWISLFISILLIGGGLYTILEANLAFQAMGIVLMIYAVLEIINYIFNRKEIVNVKTIKKDKVIDAQIVEKKQIKNTKKKGSK